jgi:hypothetical protein
VSRSARIAECAAKRGNGERVVRRPVRALRCKLPNAPTKVKGRPVQLSRITETKRRKMYEVVIGSPAEIEEKISAAGCSAYLEGAVVCRSAYRNGAKSSTLSSEEIVGQPCLSGCIASQGQIAPPHAHPIVHESRIAPSASAWPCDRQARMAGTAWVSRRQSWQIVAVVVNHVATEGQRSTERLNTMRTQQRFLHQHRSPQPLWAGKPKSTSGSGYAISIF